MLAFKILALISKPTQVSNYFVDHFVVKLKFCCRFIVTRSQKHSEFLSETRFYFACENQLSNQIISKLVKHLNISP